MVNVSIAVATLMNFKHLFIAITCVHMYMVNSTILSHGMNMYGFCACDLTVHVTLFIVPCD